MKKNLDGKEDKDGHDKALKDSSYLLQQFDGASKYYRKLIAIVEVQSRSQEIIPLGTYSDDHPSIGFVVEYTPTLVDKDMVISQIRKLPSGQSSIYELNLFISNYDYKKITAEIWILQARP
jgi:hypothetical protein